MKFNTAIFDFDGTIVDSLDSLIKIFKKLSLQYRGKELTSEEIDKLRNWKAQDVFRYLDIPTIKLPFVVIGIRRSLAKETALHKPVEGISEALLNLKKKGIKIGILTSNSHKNVSNFLRLNNLDIFNFIGSGSTLFGKDKLLEKIIRNERLNINKTIYIGDEARDIEACRKINMKVAAVTWGFNKREILNTSKPDYIMEKPHQLLKLFV